MHAAPLKTIMHTALLKTIVHAAPHPHRWDKVAACLSSEVEHSLSHPKPPVPGSVLHLKLVAAAAGATAHGSYARALEFLRSAGRCGARRVRGVL